MYLIKLASGVYYTRIATPVFLQNSHDYPKEVRFSLLTKTRREAIKRNTRLASAICSLFDRALNQYMPYNTFKAILLVLIKRVRQEFDAQVRNQPCQYNIVADTAPPAPILVATNNPFKDFKFFANELDEFIQSKRLESITHLSVTQLKQRCTDFIYFIRKRKLPATAKTAMTYRDSLLSRGLSSKTIKDYLAAIRQFFTWCVQRETIASNPFQSIKTPKSRATKASEQRSRWTLDELTKLLTSSEYCRRDNQFDWVTRLQIYHGLRPAEACQLSTADIKKVNGIYCITCSDSNEKQRLKTKNAYRLVPIHQSMIQSGFIEYLEERNHKRLKQLFDYKPHGKNHDWSFRYRTHLGKIQTDIGMKPKERPTAYSFRHTFIDELKMAEVAEHVVSEIVGHAHPNITYGRYGKNTDLQKLHEAVNAFPVLAGGDNHA
ncbi:MULTISPECIES: tyrosine-type recombinase/integrase [Vibrio]|uniref:tyrosine-type recombinase/integrase n=1 Tax=Vibrio TaxID=662 RepID=UPI000D383434|nr:tyrosine-type recombinase/integrase [Vibrio splendidus]PTP70272.1 integrase [Vibrio splendidus]